MWINKTDLYIQKYKTNKIIDLYTGNTKHALFSYAKHKYP